MGLRTWLGLKNPTMPRLRRACASAGADQGATAAAIAKVQGGAHRKASLRKFQAFAAAISPTCRSEFFQDAWALWEANAKRSGFFVELGALDGVRLSNTYVLENDFGWSGILAEPNPDCLPIIRSRRSSYVTDKCLFSRSGERLPFRIAEIAGLSRLSAIAPNDAAEAFRTGYREVTVETISLNDLLVVARAPPVIDFMSVDVEGAEYEILAPFDFDRWDVRTIAVEHNFTPQRAAILDLLQKHGYRRKWPQATYVDDWYVRR